MGRWEREREREGEKEDETAPDLVIDHQETTQLTHYMYMQGKNCRTRGLLSWRRSEATSRPRRRPPVLT